MADLLSYEEVFGDPSSKGDEFFSYEEVFGSSQDQKSDASRTWGEVATDVGVTALKGAVGLPESLVGLADIPTGGRVGRALESVGFRPGEAKEIMDGWYSDPQKEANRKVQEADGFLGTLGAMVESPSTIAHTALESAPQMLGGAAIARKGLALAPNVAPWAAAAMGEGVMGGGSAAAQMHEDSRDGLLTAKQSLAAVGSGVGTGAFGAVGGKVARRLLQAWASSWPVIREIFWIATFRSRRPSSAWKLSAV